MPQETHWVTKLDLGKITSVFCCELSGVNRIDACSHFQGKVTQHVVTAQFYPDSKA